MTKNVKIVKLDTGEILLGNVEDKGDVVVIKKSFLVTIMQDQLALIDFNRQFSDDDEITVEKKHVVYTLTANEPVTNAYIQRSTGIDLSASQGNLNVKDLTE